MNSIQRYLAEASDIRVPIGVAAGAGCLVVRRGETDYGGVVSEWSSKDWTACGEILTGHDGRITTWDAVDVLRTLHPSIRQKIRWANHYDLAADRALHGASNEQTALTLDGVRNRARAALDMLPTKLIETAVVSPVLVALNRYGLVLDMAAYTEIVAALEALAQELAAQLQPTIGTVRLRRVKDSKATWEALRQDPVRLTVYTRWKRADTCVQRAAGLAAGIAAHPRDGHRLLLDPIWRFHKHWTFASSGPAVNTLPSELRGAFPAAPEKFWVHFSLSYPYVRTEMVRSGGGEWAPDLYAKGAGIDTAGLYEAVLQERKDPELDDLVLDEVGELYTWLAREADSFWQAPMVITRGGVYLQLPPAARLRRFLNHLHQTLLSTPTVQRWRDRGAMHWTVAVGKTWADLKVLNESEAETWDEAWSAAL